MKAPRFMSEYLNFVIKEVASDFPGDKDIAEVIKISGQKRIRQYEQGYITADEVMAELSHYRYAAHVVKEKEE